MRSFLSVLAAVAGGVIVGTVVFVLVYEQTGVPEVECRDVFVGTAAACAVPSASLLPAAPLGLAAMLAVISAAILMRRRSRRSESVL